jgi:putative transposase
MAAHRPLRAHLDKRADVALGEASKLRDPASEGRRFGYRRICIVLAREGITKNQKELYGLYREEGLAVRRRRGHKRGTGTRAPITLPRAANQRWSLDFPAGVLSWGSGDRGRLHARGARSSGRHLDRLPADRARGQCSDRLARPTGDDRQRQRDRAGLCGRTGWSNQTGTLWHDIAPGEPTQNALVESFIGGFRDECLNEEVFAGLAGAHAVIER